MINLFETVMVPGHGTPYMYGNHRERVNKPRLK